MEEGAGKSECNIGTRIDGVIRRAGVTHTVIKFWLWVKYPRFSIYGHAQGRNALELKEKRHLELIGRGQIIVDLELDRSRTRSRLIGWRVFLRKHRRLRCIPVLRGNALTNNVPCVLFGLSLRKLRGGAIKDSDLKHAIGATPLRRRLLAI